MCHSTCDTCNVKDNISSCLTCSSSLSSLQYNTISNKNSSSQCSLIASSIQLLLTIEQFTKLKSSVLLNVTYNNSITETAINKFLSSFLYTSKLIEFSKLSSMTVTFGLYELVNH